MSGRARIQALAKTLALGAAAAAATACGGGGGGGGGSVNGGGGPTSCPPLADPLEDRLIHTGSGAQGVEALSVDGDRVSFVFDGGAGGERIEYVVDLANATVRGGMLRVYEVQSDSFPLWEAGPLYASTVPGSDPVTLSELDALVPGATEPWDDATSGSWFSVDEANQRLTLDWATQVPGGQRLFHRAELELEGKSLRVRVHGLAENGLAARDNFVGWRTGPQRGVEQPELVRMQGALTTPLIAFRGPVLSGQPVSDGELFFCATQLDLFQSNASDWALPIGHEVVPGADSIGFGYDTEYNTLSDGASLGAILDETLQVTVTAKLADALVTSDAPASPYRRTLATRTQVLMSSGTDEFQGWLGVERRLRDFESWGFDAFGVYFFYYWTAAEAEGVDASDQNVGPEWYPAVDETGFLDVMQVALGAGHLAGVYTVFGPMPPGQPFYDAESVVEDAAGQVKTGSYGSADEPFPLASDAAILDDVEREAQLIREAYGTNQIFTDSQTLASPSAGGIGDQIDERAGSPWPKTLREAIAARKLWLRALGRESHGPVLGEGSIATQSSNHEYLWFGYVDSVQRAINTGISKVSSSVGASDPLVDLAIPNWPVIPEYELRVVNRFQANHGNGFYIRFFGPLDGQPIVNAGGQINFPLAPEAMDRYRAYSLSYGHTGFYQSNPASAGGRFLRDAQMIKEYYLTNELQRWYLNSSVRSIHYVGAGGAQQSFEELFAASGHDGFVDPRLRIEYENGLVLWINHGSDVWPVSWEGVDYEIPEDGFVAGIAGTELVAFSAVVPATSSARFDYINAPDRYEFFDGRGTVAGYGSLTADATSPVGPRIALRQDWRNTLLVQSDTESFEATDLGEVQPVSVTIESDATNLQRGQRAGLTAIATYSNGATRDVTSLVQFRLNNAELATLEGPALVACGVGTVEVSADVWNGASAQPQAISVTD